MTPVPRRRRSGVTRRPDCRLVARRFKRGESVEEIAIDLLLRGDCVIAGDPHGATFAQKVGEVEDALRRAMVRGEGR